MVNGTFTLNLILTHENQILYFFLFKLFLFVTDFITLIISRNNMEYKTFYKNIFKKNNNLYQTRMNTVLQ